MRPEAFVMYILHAVVLEISAEIRQKLIHNGHEWDGNEMQAYEGVEV